MNSSGLVKIARAVAMPGCGVLVVARPVRGFPAADEERRDASEESPA
jgi:hypothetical protein